MVSTTTSVDNTGGPAAAQTSKMDPAMMDLQIDTDGYGARDEDCTSIALGPTCFNTAKGYKGPNHDQTGPSFRKLRGNVR